MPTPPDSEQATTDVRRQRSLRSRAAILAAAREQFGACGFERTTIRSVAGRAGVDPALVMQHFGSKVALFAAATHSEVQTTHVRNASAQDLPRAALQDVFEQFEQPEARAAAVAIMRNCLTHPQAMDMLRDDVMAAAMLATVSRTGPVDAELRAALLNSCIMGLVLARYVLEVEPLASASTAEVARLFEPALAALVDQTFGVDRDE